MNETGQVRPVAVRHRIAEAHGGRVGLDSTEGERTTVTLVLPVTD